MVPARIVQNSKSPKFTDMEYGTNNPSMHHSGDGNSVRELHGWGKASDKSDHETRRQQCRYSNIKRESDELDKPATLDDVGPCELHSRDANAKSETGGRGTWGSADGQGLADESICEIRDPNVKRAKSERGNAVRQISPDPWKQHAGDRSAKNGTDARDKDKKSNRELGKHHSRDCIDDRAASGWGSAPGKSGKDTWKHHNSYDNSKRHSDGLGNAHDRTGRSARKQPCGDGTFKREAGGWDNAKRGTDEWGKTPDMNDLDSSDQQGGKGNFKRETDGWEKASDRGGPDASRRHIRERNVKERETDIWDKAQDVTLLDSSKHHGAKGNIKRVTDGWGEAPDRREPDSSRQHIEDRKEETGGWCSKVSEDGLDTWERLSKDAAMEKKTVGWGTWDRGSGQSAADAWNHQSRDDNGKLETDGWGKPLDQLSRDPWKRRNDAKRGIDEWGKAPDMNDLDSSDQHGGKGNFKRETDGWEKASGRSDPDASRRHIRERSVKERETDIWDKAQDILLLDSTKHHGTKGNIKRVTDGWGEAPDRREPDSLKQHIEDGKEVTGAWCSKVSEDGLDTWERLSKDAAMEKKTVGWGTWATGRGQTAADAWNHKSRDDNGKLETDGWGKPLDQRSRDPWKRRNDAKRGTDEWGKAPYMNDLDSSDQHGGKGNFKRETDGREKPSGRSDPDASRRHIREHNVKERETDIWDKAQDITLLDSTKHHGAKGNIKRVTGGWGALDRREPDSLKQHIEDGKEVTGGWCSKVSEDGLDAWERAAKVAAMEKKTVGWGTWDTGRGQNAPDAWNHQSRDDSGKLETDGWGKPLDQLSRDPWKRRNDAKRETDGHVISPDPSSHDKSKRHNSSVSPELGSNRHRSWCPPVGSKRGRDSRSGAGGSAEVCNNFATGRCRWGSQCKYLHEDHCLRRLDRDISEVGGWIYEKGKNSVNENKDLKILWDQKDGHKDQSDGKDGKELHGQRDGSGRSEAGGFVDSCKSFAAGRCRRGSQCKYLHEDCGPGCFDRDIPEVKGRRYEKDKNPVNGNNDIKILCDQKDGHQNQSDGKDGQELHGQRDGSVRSEAGGFVEDCRSFAAGRCDLHEDRGPGCFDSDISEVKGRLYDKEKDSVKENKDLKVLWNQKDGHRDQIDGKNGQRDGSGRSEAGGFAEACRSFAAGQCIRGSQCKHLRKEHCPDCFDTGISEVMGQINEKERNSTNENKNLTILWDQKDGHGYQIVGEDGQELHGVKRSPTCEFLKGRCNGGPESKVAHPDANGSGQCTKDEARERTLAKPCNGPSLVPQVTSDSASNSAHSICGDGSRTAATAQLLEVKDFTQEPICRRAESCASTIQHYSQIGTDRLMMLDVESVNIKSSKKNCHTKDEVLKQELNRRAASNRTDGAQTVRSKKEQVLQPVNVSVAADDMSGIIKDDTVIRKFKFALADYVKNIIKPAWKEGRMSKEVHNLVVKKAVDKVISVLPAPNIPQTPEQIQHYLSFSETKLKSLVQGYLEKIVSAEPKRGKT